MSQRRGQTIFLRLPRMSFTIVMRKKGRDIPNPRVVLRLAIQVGHCMPEVDGKWIVIGVTSGFRRGVYEDCRLSTTAAWIDRMVAGVR